MTRSSTTGAELLFEVFSQRYERGSTIVTSNLPFEGRTAMFGAERLTGALLDRLTHHVRVGRACLCCGRREPLFAGGGILRRRGR
jgi:DNA replication protein DnaC